ncbi:GspH/FimT family pseudopilin [Ideonella livida]|uniref:Type II secretion system protein H n=1 Tax=Ideonella livida TaxID=2707176 RepID=A0A7C9TK32_9BURK|nr:GspH/FimT family protein [Ideonella livida]NDY92178.1 prepilin-type N-terminal cleavage/methylation domain-containing protein [Ideonella livida]
MEAVRSSVAKRAGLGQCGMTLVELMTTVAVAAVLVGVGLPSFTALQQRQSVQRQMEALEDAFRLARTEATLRGQGVTLCARDDSLGDETHQCAQTGQRWSGWLVFVDGEERGQVDEGDRLLLVQQPLKGDPQVRGTVRSITFGRNGLAMSAASRFGFFHGEQPEAHDTLLCVNKLGRLRRSQGLRCG